MRIVESRSGSSEAHVRLVVLAHALSREKRVSMRVILVVLQCRHVAVTMVTVTMATHETHVSGITCGAARDISSSIFNFLAGLAADCTSANKSCFRFSPTAAELFLAGLGGGLAGGWEEFRVERVPRPPMAVHGGAAALTTARARGGGASGSCGESDRNLQAERS